MGGESDEFVIVSPPSSSSSSDLMADADADVEALVDPNSDNKNKNNKKLMAQSVVFGEYPSTATLLLETGSIIYRQSSVLRNVGGHSRRGHSRRGELFLIENLQYPGRFFLVWQCQPIQKQQQIELESTTMASGSSNKCLQDLATESIACGSKIENTDNLDQHEQQQHRSSEYQEWVLEIARIHSFMRFTPRIGSPALGSTSPSSQSSVSLDSAPSFPFILVNEKGSPTNSLGECFYFENGSLAMTEFCNFFDHNLVPLRKNFDSSSSSSSTGSSMMIDGNLGVEVILDFASGVGKVSRYLIEQENSSWQDTHILTGKLPPLESERWKRFLSNSAQSNGINSLTEIEEIKKIIYAGGISPEIRLQVWKYLLGVYPWTDTASDDKRTLIDTRKLRDYAAVKSLWSPLLNDPALRPALDRNEKFRERVARIDKDVMRTERHISCFADDDAPFLTLLRNVLISYSMWNFDLGYCQGMNDCLCQFFFLADERDPTIAKNKISPSHESCQKLESEMFWLFSGMMEIIGKNFFKDGSGIAAQLAEIRQIVAKVDPQLFTVLESKSPQKKTQSDPGWEICMFRGLLLWWRRELADVGQVARLWEACWSGHLTKNLHLFFAAATLIRHRFDLMNPELGFDDLLKFTNEMAGKIDLDETLVMTERIFRRYQAITTLESKTRRPQSKS